MYVYVCVYIYIYILYMLFMCGKHIRWADPPVHRRAEKGRRKQAKRPQLSGQDARSSWRFENNKLSIMFDSVESFVSGWNAF